jgi:hypothetical protein
VRNTLAKAFWVSRGGPPEYFDNHLSGKFVYDYPPFMACIKDAETALSVFLSAPVPSPDGAPIFQCPGCECDISTEPHKPGCPRPPSPAVAAEPTYTVTKQQWDDALGTAYSCLEAPYISLADFDNAMQRAFGMLSLNVATPPVRGDREALRQKIGGYIDAIRLGATNEGVTNAIMRDIDSLALPVQPAIDKTKFYSALSSRLANDMIDIVWQAVQESGALVGVQSGAGERDALTEWFNGLEADFLLNQETRHAEYEAMLRAARQATRIDAAFDSARAFLEEK